MKVIATICSAGGTGKTSLSVSLAAELSERNNRVLIVCCDGQGTTSDWLGHDKQEEQSVLLDSLLGEREPGESIVETYKENLHLLPSSFHLFNFDRHVVDEPMPNELMSSMLRKIEDDYDYCVLDVQPQLSVLSYNCIIASNVGVLIPCECSYKSMRAMRGLLRALEVMRERARIDIPVLGIAANRYDKRTTSGKQCVELLRDTFGDTVLDTVIAESVVMRDSMSHHKSVTDYKPKSKTAEQIRSFTDEILQRINRGEVKNAAA